MADSTKAQIGSLTTIAYFKTTISPAAWALIGNIKSFGDLGVDKPEVDSTDLDSTAVERIGGLADGKEITINCIGNATTVPLIEGLFNANATIDFRITFPSPTTASRYFSVFPLGWTFNTIVPSGLIEVHLRGRISGPIVTSPTHV